MSKAHENKINMYMPFIHHTYKHSHILFPLTSKPYLESLGSLARALCTNSGRCS
jgi:hypothetical protein